MDRKRFTVVLEGVKALHIWNIREGNIVFDVSLIESDKLTEDHIESAYEISVVARDRQIAGLLSSARQEGLRMLEMTTSYGASGVCTLQRHRSLGGASNDKLKAC